MTTDTQGSTNQVETQETIATITGSHWITDAALEAMNLPPQLWAVRDLIPTGLTILAGPPKIGKSWLALGIADAVSRGVPVLQHTVESGPVLYLGLEDGNRRMQDRLRKVRRGAQPGGRLHYVTEWPLLNEVGPDGKTGLAKLEEAIVAHKPRLVVIDTLGKVRPNVASKDLYSFEYSLASSLKRLADQYNTAIVVVHHLRKMPADDPINEISGSTGLIGAADSILVLKRPRGSPDGTLFVTGRDVEREGKVELHFDKATGQWALVGQADHWDDDGDDGSVERREIVALLRGAGRPMGPKDIAGKLDKNENTVRNLLRAMLKKEQVQQPRTGLYAPIDSVDSIDSVDAASMKSTKSMMMY